MSSKQREALSDACNAMFNFLKSQNGGLCPRCIRKPELEGCFKYDRHSDRLRFQGWTYCCPNCNCRTCVCETDEKAAEKWNEMTKKKTKG